MNLIELILKSSLFITAILGWPIYIYNSTNSLKPQSPISLSKKIYFDIEEKFYNSFLDRFFQVLDSNTELISQYQVNQLAIKNYLKIKIDKCLSVLSKAKGQKDLIYKFAKRRLYSLIIVWVTLAISIILIIMGLEVSITRNNPQLIIKKTVFLIYASGLFILNFISLSYARKQTPILEDAIEILKDARNEI